MNRLDLIIAALQRVELLFEAHGQYPHTLREVNEALAAAHELRALKPVGYMDSKGVLFNNTTHPHLNTPLYTAPSKREWVGLTDDDAREVFVSTHELTVAIRLIEEKLKDKNDVI